MADPVAEKSAFLKMYMSSHPDTLVAYAKFFGKVKEQITSAEMSAIDTKSMTLTCTLRDKSKKVVVVPITPPLKGYNDVKPRLLEMKAKAQEGLGMIKSPKLSDFKMIPQVYFFIVVLVVGYLLGFPHHQIPALVRSYLPSTSQIIATESIPYSVRALVAKIAPYETKITNAAWNTTAFIFIAHSIEAFITMVLCWWYVDSPIAAILYVAATVPAGWFIFLAIYRRIAEKRIESVMKVE